MTRVTINKLLDTTEEYTYKVLTNKDKYFTGTSKYDWTVDEVVDHFRVGHNLEGDFCIEDSIGRFIPFALEDIDSLIDTLMNFRQDNDKVIEIEKLQSRIRELEDEQ